MAKKYDFTIQITVKDVRVEGPGTKAQVAKAICKSIMETMDLWGLSHGRAVEDALRDEGIEVEEVGFWGKTTCKVVNPGASPGGRKHNPGKGARDIVRDAMK